MNAALLGKLHGRRRHRTQSTHVPCKGFSWPFQSRFKNHSTPVLDDLCSAAPARRNPLGGWPGAGEGSEPAKGERRPLGDRSGSRVIHRNRIIFRISRSGRADRPRPPSSRPVAQRSRNWQYEIDGCCEHSKSMSRRSAFDVCQNMLFCTDNMILSHISRRPTWEPYAKPSH